jgi:hypothetical protein
MVSGKNDVLNTNKVDVSPFIPNFNKMLNLISMCTAAYVFQCYVAPASTY